MIVLVGSAVTAPMIGEIGQASGSVSNGVGSTNLVAVIAWMILGIVVFGCAAAFAWLRAKR